MIQFNNAEESLDFVYFDDEFTGRGNVREYIVNVAFFGHAEVKKHKKKPL